MAEKTEKVKRAAVAKPPKSRGPRGRGSDWNRDFDVHKGPKIWQAAEASGARRGE